MAKRKRKEYVVKFDDIEGFKQEFRRETDRGAALLAAAFLDEWLRKRMAAFLIDDSEKVDELLDGILGPLASFSSRIKASYCMGLVSRDEYDDLKTIRDIRNAFAHQPHDLSFSHRWVKDKCNELQLPKKLPERVRPSDARTMFSVATSFILEQLKIRIEMEKDERRVVPGPFEVEAAVD